MCMTIWRISIVLVNRIHLCMEKTVNGKVQLIGVPGVLLWMAAGLLLPLQAQSVRHVFGDTSVANSTHRWWHRTLRANYPDPKQAATLSLIIPGAGQLYNKRWWKVPLVYGALGGMVYSIRYNAEQYRRFRDAYIQALQGQPHEFTPFNLSDQAIKRYRDQFDKRRQLSWIGLVAVHLLQAADAFVDAHLMHFDVSDELSVRWRIHTHVADEFIPLSMGSVLLSAPAAHIEVAF